MLAQTFDADGNPSGYIDYGLLYVVHYFYRCRREMVVFQRDDFYEILS